MPKNKSLAKFKINGIVKCFAEAIRSIPGYQEYADKEPRALIHPELTKFNELILCNHEAMLTRGTGKSGEQLLKEYITKRLKDDGIDRTLRDDTSCISYITTLPKDFFDNLEFGLSEEEYIALNKYNEFCNGVELDSHEEELLKSALQKLEKIQWTDLQKKEIKEYFKTMSKVLCKTFGIKEEDVLYATVHMDESFPHMHFAFIPFVYGENKNKNGTNIGKVDYEVRHNEKIQGLSSSRITSFGFFKKMLTTIENNLHSFEKYKDVHLKNGNGDKFVVSELTHDERAKLVELERVSLALKQKNKVLEQRINEYQNKLEDVNAELEYKKIELDFLEADILEREKDINNLLEKFNSIKKAISNFIDSLPNLVQGFLKKAFQSFHGNWNNEKEVYKHEHTYMSQMQKEVNSFFNEQMNKLNELVPSATYREYQNDVEIKQAQNFLIGGIQTYFGIKSETLKDFVNKKEIKDFLLERFNNKALDDAIIQNENFNSDELTIFMKGSSRKERAYKDLIRELDENPDRFSNEIQMIWSCLRDELKEKEEEKRKRLEEKEDLREEF